MKGMGRWIAAAALGLGTAAHAASLDIQPAHYGFATCDGARIFYREAGDRARPTLLLLHGNPSSSLMFRDLIALLAGEFHLVAPDYPSYGLSDAPAPGKFAYTFEHVSKCVESLVDGLGVKSYGLYMQDFGVPVGMRMVMRRPERLTALIVQNGIISPAKDESDNWLLPFFERRDPVAEKRLRNSYTSANITRKYYELGAADLARISPDTWIADQYALDQPGVRDARVELMYDYRNNITAWPSWRAYLREKKPPTLVVWGRQDPIFPEEHAMTYLEEHPGAEVHLVSGGHFMLEERAGLVAELIRDFYRRVPR